MAKNGFIGYTFYDFSETINLKSKVLLFNKLYITESAVDELYNKTVDFYKNQKIKLNEKNHLQNISTFEFLLDANELEIFKRKDERYNIEEIDKLIESDSSWIELIDKSLNETKIKSLESYTKIIESKSNFHSYHRYILSILTDMQIRWNSLKLDYIDKKETYPILQNELSFNVENEKFNVLKLLLRKIPTPKEDTPWEKILDFKSDRDSIYKYDKLINWVNKVAKQNLTMNELEEEFLDLYNDYKRSYESNKIEFNYSFLEIILLGSIESLTSFHTFIPLKIANDLFKLKKETMAITKAELSFPGRELAYIYKLEQKFI